MMYIKEIYSYGSDDKLGDQLDTKVEDDDNVILEDQSWTLGS